jgi:hypothetical protein|tara:strand:+ start:7533 stop:8039 length:507 start_codon:yes stop_codon:yes gene_type:complete
MKNVESFKQFNENSQTPLNEGNGQTLKEFGDLLALLRDDTLAIEKSIGEMDGKKARTLQKQITTLYNSLFKLDESVNEAKSISRDDMMDWIGKSMRIAGTSEDFNGSPGGIWVSGEDSDEYKGNLIYSYYAEGKSFELGVNVKWEKELNKRGWYSEWYDAGTIQIWEI